MVIDNYYYRKHTNIVGFELPLVQSAIQSPLTAPSSSDHMSGTVQRDPMTGEAGGGWGKVAGYGGWVGMCGG